MNWLVIMAGGSGERFWPLSRRAKPKQFQPIVGNTTMIQQTVARLRPLFDPARMVVVTTKLHAPQVRKQLPQVKHILAEPVGRNTAPCIGWAAQAIQRLDPAAVMAVVPADSWIGDVPRYRRVVQEALALAQAREVLITIGIQPTAPHTGYGYIQVGEKLNRRFWWAQRFVEKPDLATAKRYVASGDYRWNAGMFVWSAAAITNAYQKYQPAMAAQLQGIRDGRSLARIYPTLEKISVDYAIMEQADNVVVANGDFPWDDVGDWPAIGRHFAKDGAGNVARGAFAGVDAKGCVVVSEPGHLVGVIGLADLVIVHTADATLVCRKQDAQRVKELVVKLGTEPRFRKLL